MTLSLIGWLRKLALGGLNRASRQGRVYALLALVNLGGVGATVIASQSMMASYEGSVRALETDADHLQMLGDLLRIAGDANAPGNDVFETRAPAAERAQLASASTAFRDAMSEAKGPLAEGLDPAEAAMVADDLDAAERAFGQMERSAEDVFVAFESTNAGLAAKHMAAMDTRFGEVRRHLASVGALARAHQRAQLAASLRSATSARRASDAIGAAVVLIVLGVSAYGLRLARRFASAQQELARRTRDMRIVLDHVDVGLATVTPEGRVGEERSAAVHGWLGAPQPHDTLWTWLGRSNAKAGAQLDAAWSQLVDGFLPTEVALDQLPKEVRIGERDLTLTVRPIGGDGGVEQWLVVLADVTAARHAARAEQSQMDLLRVVDRALSDRPGTVEFFEEAARLVARIAAWSGDWRSPELARDLHTLKGNAGLFGLSHLAETCHLLEMELTELGEIDREHAQSLLAVWRELGARISPLLGDRRDGGRLEIEREEHGTVLAMLAGVSPREVVRRRLASWRHEPISKRFATLGEHAQRLGETLGKGTLSLEIEGGHHRLPSSSWASFWAGLIHVVRNAVDHGIESPEERIAARKTATGKVTLRAAVEEGELRIVVRDDGRGIDWVALRRKARELGLPHGSDAELVEVMFSEGVTTRHVVTEISGRGVGAGAARAACERLQGRVAVSSSAGRGTAFTFSFDQSVLEC